MKFRMKDLIATVFLVVWAVELMDHAGVLPGAGHPTGVSHA